MVKRRYMRLILMFDLPTLSPEDKKDYRKFRKFLINEGFLMHQFSVYTKLLLNDTQTESMIKRVKSSSPNKGTITLLKVTEKQYARMIYLHGKKDVSYANSDKRIVYLGEAHEKYKNNV